MDKEVPLVVYKDGERHVVGKAKIHEGDGVYTIEAEVDDSDFARSLLPTIHMGELSVRRPIVPTEWVDPNPPITRFFMEQEGPDSG